MGALADSSCMHAGPVRPLRAVKRVRTSDDEDSDEDSEPQERAGPSRTEQPAPATPDTVIIQPRHHHTTHASAAHESAHITPAAAAIVGSQVADTRPAPVALGPAPSAPKPQPSWHSLPMPGAGGSARRTTPPASATRPAGSPPDADPSRAAEQPAQQPVDRVPAADAGAGGPGAERAANSGLRLRTQPTSAAAADSSGRSAGLSGPSAGLSGRSAGLSGTSAAPEHAPSLSTSLALLPKPAGALSAPAPRSSALLTTSASNAAGSADRRPAGSADRHPADSADGRPAAAPEPRVQPSAQLGPVGQGGSGERVVRQPLGSISAAATQAQGSAGTPAHVPLPSAPLPCANAVHPEAAPPAACSLNHGDNIAAPPPASRQHAGLRAVPVAQLAAVGLRDMQQPDPSSVPTSAAPRLPTAAAAPRHGSAAMHARTATGSMHGERVPATSNPTSAAPPASTSANHEHAEERIHSAHGTGSVRGTPSAVAPRPSPHPAPGTAAPAHSARQHPDAYAGQPSSSQPGSTQPGSTQPGSTQPGSGAARGAEGLSSQQSAQQRRAHVAAPALRVHEDGREQHPAAATRPTERPHKRLALQMLPVASHSAARVHTPPGTPFFFLHPCLI